MALSGSFGSNVGSYWRIQVEWSATQNASANTSRVTARLYWMAQRSGVGLVTASSPGTASVTINGSADTTSASPKLSAGQKKLIHTHAVTVAHNSDGTKTFNMSAFFDVNATLSGSYVGRVSTSGSATLNTIPRESTLSSNANWTAGKDTTVSVTRHSSNFTHELEISMQNRAGAWVWLKRVDLSSNQTSASTSFSSANNQSMYDLLDGRASAPSRIVVQTFSGSTMIGETTRTGTVTALKASYPVIPSSFNIGSAFNVQSAYYSRDFTHDIRLKNGSTVLKTITVGPVGAGVDSIASFTTSDIATALYNLTPTSNSRLLTIEITTRLGSHVVRSAQSKNITARVTGSNPTFTATPAYSDINTTTVAITGNNQHIISGKSNVRVTLTAAQRALPRNGATMVRYIATLGGKSVSQNYSTSATLTFNFGAITASTNQSLVISAVDSRGNTTPVTRSVTVIPYSNPGVSASATRVNGFEEDTILTLSGTFSSIKVNDVERNSLSSARYRTKATLGTAWGGWTTYPVTGFPSFTGTDRTIVLNRLNSFDIQFEVTDKLGTTTLTRTVSSGKPLMFIDELLGSIGMGEFPTQPNQLLLTHQIDFAAGRFGTGNYAMDLNKGNIHGANGIFFNDTTQGSEGIGFLKTGRPVNSRVYTDYQTLNARDDVVRFDGTPIAYVGNRELWSGTAYPNATQEIVPSMALNDCPNGWVLVWSRYVIGGSASNAGYNFTHVPKEYGSLTGAGLHLMLPDLNGVMREKYIYVSNTAITASSLGSTGDNRLVALRYVLAY